MKRIEWMEWLPLFLFMMDLVVGFYAFHLSFGSLLFFDIWVKKRTLIIGLMILCLISGGVFMMMKTDEFTLSMHTIVLWLVECEWYFFLLWIFVGLLFRIF